MKNDNLSFPRKRFPWRKERNDRSEFIFKAQLQRRRWKKKKIPGTVKRGIFKETITKENVPLPDPSNSSSTPLYRRWVIRNALGIFFLIVFVFFSLFASSNHRNHTLDLSDLTSLSHTNTCRLLENWRISRTNVEPPTKRRCPADLKGLSRTLVPVAKHRGASASRISGVIVAPAKIRGYI